jgi:anti-sigma B factor antagonist
MSIESHDTRTLLGRLADDPQFTDDVDSLMSRELPAKPRIVLDLSDVHYMNSSNIAKLLRLRKMIVERDGTLVLVTPSPQVWSVFTVTGLDKVFHFAGDLKSGLQR